MHIRSHDKKEIVRSRPETITALVSNPVYCLWPTTVHNSQLPWVSRP